MVRVVDGRIASNVGNEMLKDLVSDLRFLFYLDVSVQKFQKGKYVSLWCQDFFSESRVLQPG